MELRLPNVLAVGKDPHYMGRMCRSTEAQTGKQLSGRGGSMHRGIGREARLVPGSTPGALTHGRKGRRGCILKTKADGMCHRPRAGSTPATPDSFERDV